MKFQLKKVAIICSLSLAIFSGSFYLVNFLDLSPASKDAAVIKSAQISSGGDEELRKRSGSDAVNIAAFDGWAKVNSISGNNPYDGDPDGDGMPNYLEYIHGTDPKNLDSDGDSFSDGNEIAHGYDPSSKGGDKVTVSVKIDKIGIVAPMVWSKTDVDTDMLSDLENGVSHFVKTASPGQIGNMIISGHSSNYIWAKGGYNHIFENLNDLETGDIISFRTVQKNGMIIDYRYKVNDKFVTAPDDVNIFADTPAPTLTLSTCWPIGTNLKRVIIKADII